MSTTKVAVTLERDTLEEIDRWVRQGQFPSRSHAIQTALAEMTARRKRRRLIEELAKLDRRQELSPRHRSPEMPPGPNTER